MRRKQFANLLFNFFFHDKKQIQSYISDIYTYICNIYKHPVYEIEYIKHFMQISLSTLSNVDYRLQYKDDSQCVLLNMGFISAIFCSPCTLSFRGLTLLHLLTARPYLTHYATPSCCSFFIYKMEVLMARVS